MHCRDFGSLTEIDLLYASLTLLSTDNVLVMEEGDLNDIILQLGIGWRGASLSRMHYRSGTAHDMAVDLGFTNKSFSFLQDHQRLDTLLYVLVRYLLRLDVRFHAGVAALSGNLEESTSNENLHASRHQNQIDLDSAIHMAGYRKVAASLQTRSRRSGHASSATSLNELTVLRKRLRRTNVPSPPGVTAAF